MSESQGISTYMTVIKINDLFFAKINTWKNFPGSYKLVKLTQKRKKEFWKA